MWPLRGLQVTRETKQIPKDLKGTGVPSQNWQTGKFIVVYYTIFKSPTSKSKFEEPVEKKGEIPYGPTALNQAL